MLDRIELTAATTSLGKFVAVSVLLFAAWPWVSQVYVEGLILGLNGVLLGLDHPARYVRTGTGLHVVYSSIISTEPLVLQVLHGIRIHFNLILLLALVVSAPLAHRNVGWWALVWGIPVLAIGHGLYLYLFTWISVWDWIESGAALAAGAPEDLTELTQRLQQHLPYETRLRLQRPFYYLNDFGREGLPFLVWLLGTTPTEADTGTD